MRNGKRNERRLVEEPPELTPEDEAALDESLLPYMDMNDHITNYFFPRGERGERKMSESEGSKVVTNVNQTRCPNPHCDHDVG